jgi:hypothetical protein
MTVTVRPVPKRTYQNGIRPFRPVVPTNNVRPYTLKAWRPPVPEPLPPAPLLGPKELLGLGALVLAQIWGRFASRPATKQSVPYPYNLTYTGKVPATGNTTPATFEWWAGPGQTEYGLPPTCQGTGVQTYTTRLKAGTVSNVVEVQPYQEAGTCGPYRVGFRVRNNLNQWSLTVLTAPGPGGWRLFTQPFDAQWAGTNAVDLVNPTTTVPLPSGYVAPTPEVEPLAEPAIVPRPAPTTPIPAPPEIPSPETEPQPQPVPVEPGPSRRPVAPPLVIPGRPGTRTLPLPGATPTKDGAIVPQAPATVAVTPPDAHFPVPGAPPVTGNGPRPTPEGIAQELGRLEQKLARLSDPGPEGPGDGSDRLQLISDLIGRLIEFATSMTSGGGYGLSSPCEVDENGERIVTTVNYSGATNSLGVLSNKVDALAALIQAHKDLKQPNCKQPAAVGQPVTVNFVQVD